MAAMKKYGPNGFIRRNLGLSLALRYL